MDPVESKLDSFGRVRGIVFGNFGECSEDTHQLLDNIATSRVRVAGPQDSRKGWRRTEEGERAVIVGYLRRMVSVAAVKAQCHLLLGRLEAMGPGTAQVRNRRMQAMELERGCRLIY